MGFILQESIQQEKLETRRSTVAFSDVCPQFKKPSIEDAYVT